MRAVETIVQTNAPGKVLPILTEELDGLTVSLPPATRNVMLG